MHAKSRNLLPWLASVALLLGGAANLHSATLTARWIGTADGDWFDPANWDIGQAPDNIPGGDEFDVVWEQDADDNPVTITLNGSPLFINDFGFYSSGMLTGAMRLIIQGDLEWVAGTIAGSGTAVVVGEANLWASPPNTISLDSLYLELQGRARLRSPISLTTRSDSELPAALIVSPTGELVMEERAAIQVVNNGLIVNGGTLRIASSSTMLLCDASILNGGVLELEDRAVYFGPGKGITNFYGTLRVNGGWIQKADNHGGLVRIQCGGMEGQGDVDLAHVGDAVYGCRAYIAGQIDFRELTLEPTASALPVTLRGRGAGMFDHHHVQDRLRLGGNLEIRFADGFEYEILPADVFEILTPAPGCQVAGAFENVAFGQRLDTLDDQGSFVVDRLPGTDRIVLRDFDPGERFRLENPRGISTYPLGLPGEFDSLLLHLETTLLLAQAYVNWNNATLRVEITQGYLPGNDSLAVEHVEVQLVSDRILYYGVDFGSWASNGATIQFHFNASATSEMIQTLIYRLTFFNNAYTMDRFVTGAEQFGQRSLELTLATGTGYQAVLQSLVEFPFMTGLRFEPNGSFGGITNSTLRVDLLSIFSDGSELALPNLLVTTAPCPMPSPQGLLACLDVTDPSKVVIATAGVGKYPVTAQAGSFEARLCVTVYESQDPKPLDCPLKHVFQNPGGPDMCFPPSAARVARALGAEGMSGGSLAIFYALQALMKQTASGQALVDAYWQHGPEIIGILITRPELHTLAEGVLASFRLALMALLSGNGQQAVITQDMIDDLNMVWSGVAGYASAALRTALETERARFNNFQDFVNVDSSQWATMLQLPVPTQPWVHLSSVTLAASQFSVEANNVVGWQLSLWRSDDLAMWEPVPGALAEPTADLNAILLTDPAPLPGKLFYQVRAAVIPAP